MLHASASLAMCCIVGALALAQAPDPKRVAAAEEALTRAREALATSYESLEAELKTGGERVKSLLLAELRPVADNWRNATAPQVIKLLGEGRKKLLSLARHDDRNLAELAAWMAQRFNGLVQEKGAALAKESTEDLCGMLLSPLLDSRAFHERWNAELAPLLPSAEVWRKATLDLEGLREAAEVAKDPSRTFRRGAPAGFARIPAGTYSTIFSGGFSGQGVRKKDRPFVLGHDLFLGVDEVTQAEYLAWILSLSEEERRLHQPRDDSGKPRWEAAEGTGVLALVPGSEKLPVTGITLASAIAFANANGARLPTEEEWCAAASGKERFAYPWGARYDKGRCNDRDGGLGALAPVGSFAGARGPFGHNDLAGNASEWTLTLESGKVLEPGAEPQENVVVRGGSFKNSGADVTTGWVWLKRAVGDRDTETGFRLLIDPAAKAR